MKKMRDFTTRKDDHSPDYKDSGMGTFSGKRKQVSHAHKNSKNIGTWASKKSKFKSGIID